MRKPEQRQWDYLRGQMAGRWDAQRHEDRYCQDIPDVSFGLQGIDGWIELKTIKAWPKRVGTPLNIPHLTAGQVNWIEARYAHGGRNSFLLLAVGAEPACAEWSIFRGNEVRRLKGGGFRRTDVSVLWSPACARSLGVTLGTYLASYHPIVAVK